MILFKGMVDVSLALFVNKSCFGFCSLALATNGSHS